MKKIIHVDMDCFYAQVEMRDRPELAKVPLAIGGPPHSRSVLCTSNYIAREYGVRSAMPTDMAVKLCPDLVVLRPNFDKYVKISKEIHEVFNKYSTAVESISLDEAYLDVSHHVNATETARKIKEDILLKTKLTASVGVAPNKFLAKIASDWKKPNGLFVIRPEEVKNFIPTLPVKLIPGIGKKSQEILDSLNIKTCQDLHKAKAEELSFYFGKFAQNLIDFSQGIDHRIVSDEGVRKSLSVENTFSRDLVLESEIKQELYDVYEEMYLRLTSYIENYAAEYNSANLALRIKKVFVKLKYSDFKTSTSEELLVSGALSTQEDLSDFSEFHFERFLALYKTTISKRNAPIRLIGLGVRFLCPKENDQTQLSFFDLDPSLCA